MYIVSAIIIVFILVNYILGYKLYAEPKSERYFNNVNELNFSKGRYLAPEPKYIVTYSIFTGIFIGMYVALSLYKAINNWVIISIVMIILIGYLIEITRTIVIREDKLILSKLFSKKIEITGRNIKGMYIYSYNKKFLKSHALTTKLVVSTNDGKKYKFVLASLNNKAVLNMMKDNFGIVNNKIFISKNDKNDIKENV